jgi:hypothetical protein
LEATGTKAGRAGEDVFDQPTLGDFNALKVGKKAPVGRSVGMADGLSSHRTFAAFITGICHGDYLGYEEDFISI